METADEQGRGNVHAGGHMKGRTIEHHQAGDPFGEAHRPCHADHRAPVVHDQSDAMDNIQMVEQCRQVVGPALQAVAVLAIVGLVRQAHAHMVGHHHAVLSAQGKHQ